MQTNRRTPSSALRFVKSSRFAATGLILLAGAMLSQAAALPNTVTIRNYFKVGTDSLTFNRPLLVKPYPGEDSAFIVLQQNGRLLTVRWNGSAWRKTDSASITVTGGTSGITEQGLLGFAFHPQYLTNRKYYVYYITGGGTTQNPWIDYLAERKAGVSGRPATSDSQRTISRITDPYDNHNAGTLGFDKEGYLVYAIGDGGPGSGGDPQRRSQNPDSLLGKFMRLDVDGPDAYPSDTTRNYAIPATNPFKDSVGYRPEIWARGLRNPWKWTFHPVTGEIWAGDVGQDMYEEITKVPKGGNLGWSIMEGNSCFNHDGSFTSPLSSCTKTGITQPALAISHTTATCITGGTFFIGNPASAFDGTYIFGDHGKHTIWAAHVQGDTLVDLTVIGNIKKISSFDRDRQGRILASDVSPDSGFGITSNNGRIFVLESPDMVLAPVSVRAERLNHAPVIHAADVLRNPERYVLHDLDGRALRAAPAGAFFAADKSRPGETVLMNGVR